jgi:hypothetical protein
VVHVLGAQHEPRLVAVVRSQALGEERLGAGAERDDLLLAYVLLHDEPNGAVVLHQPDRLGPELRQQPLGSYLPKQAQRLGADAQRQPVHRLPRVPPVFDLVAVDEPEFLQAPLGLGQHRVVDLREVDGEL